MSTNDTCTLWKLRTPNMIALVSTSITRTCYTMSLKIAPELCPYYYEISINLSNQCRMSFHVTLISINTMALTLTIIQEL